MTLEESTNIVLAEKNNLVSHNTSEDLKAHVKLNDSNSTNLMKSKLDVLESSPLKDEQEPNKASQKHESRGKNDPSSECSEKDLVLEERKLAFEERRLALQEKKIAIEEKILELESRKLALLKEKQGINNTNHCDKSNDGEKSVKKETNAAEALLPSKQSSSISHSTKNIVEVDGEKEINKNANNIGKEVKKLAKNGLDNKTFSNYKCTDEKDFRGDVSLHKETVQQTKSEANSSYTKTDVKEASSKTVYKTKCKSKKLLMLPKEKCDDNASEQTCITTEKLSSQVSPKQVELKLDCDPENRLSSPLLSDKKCNNLFKYFNCVSKSSGTTASEETESTPGTVRKEKKQNPGSVVPKFDSEIIDVKTLDKDLKSACTMKSKLKLKLPSVMAIDPLESQLGVTLSKESLSRVRDVNENSFRRSPRKRNVNDQKSNVVGEPEEKINKLSKSKTTKQKWQMRIMPTSSSAGKHFFPQEELDEQGVIDKPATQAKAKKERSVSPKRNEKKAQTEQVKIATIVNSNFIHTDQEKCTYTEKKLERNQHLENLANKIDDDCEQQVGSTKKKQKISSPKKQKNELPLKNVKNASSKQRKMSLQKIKESDMNACSPSPSTLVHGKDESERKTGKASMLVVADSSSDSDEIIIISKKKQISNPPSRKKVLSKQDSLSFLSPRKSLKITGESSPALESESTDSRPKRERRKCTINKDNINNETEINETKQEKRSDRNRASKSTEKLDDASLDDIEVIETKIKPGASNQNQISKAPVKLAPLFMKKQKTPKEVKPMIDPSVLEARQQFLKSGVPECVKKITEIIFRNESEDAIFPTLGTSHITQEDSSDIWNLPSVNLNLLPLNDEHPVLTNCVSVGSLLVNKTESRSVINQPGRPELLSSSVCCSVGKQLKIENPNFPKLYHTYKLLRDKNLTVKPCETSVTEKVKSNTRKRSIRNSKKKLIILDSDEETKQEIPVMDKRFQMWNEKYKPMSGDEVIGNKHCVRELKQWLESWKKFRNCDNPRPLKKRKKRSNSSSEDEFIDDNSDDGDDNEDMPGNTAILYGTHGCGKTSMVYALANELGFEVLESNASTKRSGKCLLGEFQGATQIHRLCSNNDKTKGAEDFFKSRNSKKKHRPKQDLGEIDSNTNSKMSVVLIDEADIMFEEHDEGFISALVTLVSTSRRPIIFIGNNSDCPYLARFYEDSLVLDFVAPSIHLSTVWLQLIALFEGIRASKEAVQQLLKLYRGNIARSLLQLQFWILSGGNNLPKVMPVHTKQVAKEPLLKKIDVDGDDSDSACFTEGYVSDLDSLPIHDECINVFAGNETNVCPYPINLSTLWWNLAPMLSMPQVIPNKPVKKQFESSESVRNLYEQLQTEFCDTDEDISLKKLQVVPVAQDEMKEDKHQEQEMDISENCVIEPTVEIAVSDERDVNPSIRPRVESTCSQVEMDVISRLFNNLSAMDILLTNPRLNGDTFDTHLCPRVWERDGTGVVIHENYRPCWDQDETLSRNVIHYVTESSVQQCWETLQTFRSTSSVVGFNSVLPEEESVRWRYDQQDADNTILNLVPSYVLPDHRAIFTDYVPIMQSICLHEMRRFERNTTRLNRFFHYLKGLGIHPSDETLNILSSTFTNGLWQVGD